MILFSSGSIKLGTSSITELNGNVLVQWYSEFRISLNGKKCVFYLKAGSNGALTSLFILFVFMTLDTGIDQMICKYMYNKIQGKGK